VRTDAKWGMRGLMAVVVLGACGGDPQTRFQQSETVTVTASCGAGNQIDVDVDKWVIRIKKKGEVTFAPVVSGGASVEITAKQDSTTWPFDERPPFNGGGRGKAKDKNGTYHYNVRVACPLPTGDSSRVVIDPDVIVN
jgi:hypothetical protein